MCIRDRFIGGVNNVVEPLQTLSVGRHKRPEPLLQAAFFTLKEVRKTILEGRGVIQKFQFHAHVAHSKAVRIFYLAEHLRRPLDVYKRQARDR